MSGRTAGDWRTSGEVQVKPTRLMRATVRAEEDIPDDGEGGPTHSSLLVFETSSFKPGEAEANARLGAAAPDLLEALAAIVRWYGHHDGGPMIGAARAAIAKAEGRS